MKSIHSHSIVWFAIWCGLMMAAAPHSIASQTSALDSLAQQAIHDPHNPNLQRRLAALCLQQHYEAQALTAAAAARQADPGDIQSKHLLASALARTGNYQQAISVMAETPLEAQEPDAITHIIDAAKRASETDPKLQAAIQANNRIALADAADQLETALQSDPENPAIRKTLGWVYLDKLHWPRKAYPHIKRLAQMHPEDADAQKLLALACSQTGRLHRAVAGFKKVLARDPQDTWMQFNEARTLARLDRRDEAEALYAQILKENPTNFSARFGQAELTAWRGRLAPAESSLRELLREKPGDPEAELLLADIHRWDWDLSEARVEYAQVLQQEPDFYDAQMGQRALREAAGWILGGSVYHFTDNTEFGRSSVEGSLRIPLSDKVYFLGRGVGWRFTNPGFKDIDRLDGFGGLEIHAAQWFAISGQFGAFSYDHRNTTYGGLALARISPVPDEDFYVSIGAKEPFVSSIVTVAAGLRQDSVGGGCNLLLGNGFFLKGTFQAARITDGNQWLDAKPRLAYQLLRNPDLHVGVEYEYLSYEEARSTYWTPHDRHVVSPVADFSMDLWRGILKVLATAQSPYVFSESKFGVEVQAGPDIRITDRLHLAGSYIYSSVPGDSGAWSGSGWQASLSLIF